MTSGSSQDLVGPIEPCVYDTLVEEADQATVRAALTAALAVGLIYLGLGRLYQRVVKPERCVLYRRDECFEISFPVILPKLAAR